MAFNLANVSELARARGVKILVHGPPGVGKTSLCATTGHPEQTAIICAEGGLLSIRNTSLVGGEVRTWAEFEESYRYFAYDQAALAYFKTICLDSITEIAEICLANELAIAKDPRQAYGALYDKFKTYVRAFKDLPYNVVFIAQQARQTIDGVGTLHVPTVPGKKLLESNWLSHQFDEVLSYRLVPDGEGNTRRLLQTQPDASYDAKDRSSSLEFWELPNLEAIYAKIIDAPPPTPVAASVAEVQTDDIPF